MLTKDENFDGYVVTTVNPGNFLFLFALSICIMPIMGLPLIARCIRKRKENQKKCVIDTSKLDDHTENLEMYLCIIPKVSNETPTTATSLLGIDNEEHPTTSSCGLRR